MDAAPGVALIGAGKFGTMFLSQARDVPGLKVRAVADLNVDQAAQALTTAGWSDDERQRLLVTSDAMEAVGAADVDIVIDATGSPIAGAHHALAAFAAEKHVVMVTVEADALVGPLLAQRADAAGVVYSLAYGDQPALICELVDWARTCDFEVVCAGKGTKYLPEYHRSTPDTVWDHYGFTPEMVASSGANPKLFNSFLDGTKSAIEMASVANACDLPPQDEGLAFPPCSRDAVGRVCRGRTAGGVLSREGTVEVVSSLNRDGSEIEHDLRWGVFVVFRAKTPYAARCFAEYGVSEGDDDVGYLYRPFHFIGLELAVSVTRIAEARRPTGRPIAHHADVVARTKRKLAAGTRLDGEVGYTVYGHLMPAHLSLRHGALPMGLATNVEVIRDLDADAVVTWDDVRVDAADPLVRLRREMEVGSS